MNETGAMCGVYSLVSFFFMWDRMARIGSDGYGYGNGASGYGQGDRNTVRYGAIRKREGKEAESRCGYRYPLSFYTVRDSRTLMNSHLYKNPKNQNVLFQRLGLRIILPFWRSVMNLKYKVRTNVNLDLPIPQKKATPSFMCGCKKCQHGPYFILTSPHSS